MSTALLATGACSDVSAPPEASPSPSESSSPSVTGSEPTSSGSPGNRVDASRDDTHPITSAVRLEGFDTVAALPGSGHPRGVGVLAVAENGDVLTKSLGGAEVVSLLPAGSATGRPIATIEDQDIQAYAGDLTDRYAVWMEVAGTELMVDPWVLRAFDRRTGEVETLAKAPLMEGGGPPPARPGFTGATLDGDRVFWAQVSGRPGAELVDVYGCVVSDCRPRVYARGSAFPVAVDGVLYVIAAERFAGAKRSQTMRVNRVNPRTGRSATLVSVDLEDDQAPNGLAAAAGTVAWVIADADSDVVHIRPLGGDSEIAVTAGPNGAFGYPIATDRYVAWAEASGTFPIGLGGFLYDLARGRLFTVGNTAGLYGINGSGPFVTWQEKHKSAYITVVARLR